MTVTGCSQSGRDSNGTERAPARSLRELESARLDRAATEGDTDTPVARLFVNDDVVEIEDILRPIRNELAEAAETLPPQRYQEVVHKKIIQEFRRQVRDLLLYQEAAKRLSERESELFEGFIDDAVRKQVNADYGGRQSRYEKALRERGLTIAEDRERIRRNMVVMRYLHQNVTSRVLDPTRAELVRFFEERKDEMVKPERRKMSLIEVSGVSPGSRVAIEAAMAELVDGADFSEVAVKYSGGVHADEGGAWDWLTQGSVRAYWEPAVEKLFQIHEGEVSPIIETDEAFFIVRCDAIEPAIEPDFEQMQPKLMGVYRDVQFNRMVDERVRQLQQKAVFVPENVGRFLQSVANAATKPE